MERWKWIINTCRFVILEIIYDFIGTTNFSAAEQKLFDATSLEEPLCLRYRSNGKHVFSWHYHAHYGNLDQLFLQLLDYWLSKKQASHIRDTRPPAGLNHKITSSWRVCSPFCVVCNKSCISKEIKRNRKKLWENREKGKWRARKLRLKRALKPWQVWK